MDAPDLNADVELEVEVAYGLPQRQLVIRLSVPQGTTVLETVLLSGIAEQFPGLEPLESTLGIFGEVVDPARCVEAGQRVEIYRPLLVDPKEVRRQLAAEGRTIGSGSSGD
ncbi:MAG: RnfH family protein [Gammaproteobacteria bacterium]|nr:RnfH family protein [Gammaproteobacteria bacterium]NNF61094.1 RnfH family protein [Gammaproteobacteria bacterium]